LIAFSDGHPDCRILITTRPIGYRAASFNDWRHYDIFSLDPHRAYQTAAKLIEAIASPDSELHRNATEICRRELKDQPIAEVVGRTPLLIGLSVAILNRGKGLGHTREKVFAQIFELISEVPNLRIPEPPAPAVLLRRFLEILGWHISSEPLATINQTISRCAADLATDTDQTQITAAANAERYLSYWQDIGVIERVGQGGQQILAFVHKSFGEFAAAHYLCAIAQPKQQETVRAILDMPSWAEVIRLSGMLGMADVLVPELLNSTTKRLILATELVAEAEPPPNQSLRVKVFEQAFAVVTGPQQHLAFDIGNSLAASARRFPRECGTIASRHLQAKEPWSRLIAWACAVAAGKEYYALEDLMATLRESIEASEPGFIQSLSGGIVLGRTHSQELVEAFALQASRDILDRAPADAADALLPDILRHYKLGSVDFVIQATQLIRANGRNYELRNPDWRTQLDLSIDPTYYEAIRIRHDLILEALDVTEACDAAKPMPSTLLHLSAFIDASQMDNGALSDFRSWLQPFDRTATIVTLRGLIAATGLNRDMLREDFVYAKRYLNSSADSSYYALTTQVDTASLEWRRARSLGLNVKQIEAAINHSSLWIKWIAGNLLESLLDSTNLEAVVSRLLATGRGENLWIAAGLARVLPKEQALAMTFERLARPLAPGCKHLFELLIDLDPPWSPNLRAAMQAGLFAIEVDTATKAAELARNLAEPNSHELQPILKQAYAHWLKHEDPYPKKGGVIPTSPRANLVEALRKVRPPPYETIKHYLLDARSDVKELGFTFLLERLHEPDGERLQFFCDVEAENLPGHIVGKILKSSIPLDEESLAAVERLLESPNKVLRYNAMAVLNERYMKANRIRGHVERMLSDSEQQIKDRAYSLYPSEGLKGDPHP
jgi:hypothetical protein